MTSLTATEIDYFTNKAITVCEKAANYLSEWANDLFSLDIFQRTELEDPFVSSTLSDVIYCGYSK